MKTSISGAHSTRSASSSAAKKSGLDMATIIKAAGGSNASTFLFMTNPLNKVLKLILVRQSYLMFNS